MSNEQKISAEEALRLKSEGKIGKVDLDVDANSPEARKFVQDILKKKDEQQGVSNVQEIVEENEDLKNKLAIIAEKQFEKKRKEVGAPDEVNTPEKLQGFIAAKQGKPELGGVAPLNSYQMGGAQQATDLAHRKFANIEEAIAVLQSEKRKGNAEAENLLTELWKRGIRDWRVAGHPSQTFSQDDQVPKTSGTVDVNFDDAKFQGSELERFGIRKTPYGYSKQKQIVAQKGKEGSD